MCTVLLPPGVNPTAVNKYIKYQNVDTKRYILLEIDFSLVFFIFISNGDFYASVCVCVYVYEVCPKTKSTDFPMYELVM